MDTTKADAVSAETNSETISRKQVLLHGGAEDFFDRPPFSVWKSVREQVASRQTSSTAAFDPLIKQLVDYFEVMPPAFDASDPPIRSLAYYPLRLVISEWMFYSLLLSRYVQHYEYTLISFKSRVSEMELERLQPWRRRCFRSQQKLDLLRMFVQEHTESRADNHVKDVWDLILIDVNHISKQIAYWASFLDSMVPLLDTHQSLLEAQDVRRLTYMALIFLPLSLVASIFSMAEKVLPWGGDFWLYFAVSLPLTLVIVSLSAFMPKILNALKLQAAVYTKFHKSSKRL